MIQTAEKNSISSFPSYERLHKHFFIGKNPKGQTNSIIQISSYSLKLDFSIVELQKRGNSLFSFRKRANECLISQKRVFAHFLPSHHDNLCYLKALGIIHNKKPHSINTDTNTIDHVLATVEFFKSKGFTEPDFPRLAYLCPQLFTTNCDPTDFAPVFDFLATKLPATTEESRSLILHCPRLLFSDVEFCLQPTLDYLRQLGMENLSSPSSLNAHLLNTRANKLREKIGFFRSIGFSQEEVERACVRFPTMFGYRIDNNLWPKFKYLVDKTLQQT